MLFDNSVRSIDMAQDCFLLTGNHWPDRRRRNFGSDHRSLMSPSQRREPAAFVVRRMQLEFLKPARIDDILEVTTRVKATAAAALTLDQRICRGERELFSAEVMVVLISRSGKPQRLDAALRDALQDARI